MPFVLQPASLLLLLLLLVGSLAQTYGEDPVVVTPLGAVRGSLMSTRLNKTIYAFRGIRYAKSPEGERRFSVSDPVDAWSDVLDASQDGPACYGVDNRENFSEDCLRLNVYSTKLSSSKAEAKRPVIVFLHPGAFYAYSALSSTFAPQYFLDQDIVLVTINYRLITLGFVATGDARAPGNLGLKDQVVALRWIQKNIAAFGGNPHSVTLSGYSAGATSAVLHMLSPMSKGLFHRVISMSGAAIPAELYPTNQTNLLIKQATFVGCPTQDLDAAFDCLKKLPVDQIKNSIPKFAEWYGDPVVVWSPVVEPEIPGVERFLPAQPADLIRQKAFQHVPIIIGITKDEFAAAPLRALIDAKNGNDTVFKNITEKWNFAAPISFGYERDTQRSSHISRELYKFYFKDKPITASNGENLGLIYADSLTGFPTHRTAKLLAQYSRAPVYSYLFTYQGRFSYALWPDTKKPYGVVHHDDLQYLFYMPFIFPYLNNTDPETTMIDKYTAIHANFAKTGHPVPRNNKLFWGVTWPAMNFRTKNYLEIGEKFTMKSKLYADRYALWDRLFPLS